MLRDAVGCTVFGSGNFSTTKQQYWCYGESGGAKFPGKKRYITLERPLITVSLFMAEQLDDTLCQPVYGDTA